METQKKRLEAYHASKRLKEAVKGIIMKELPLEESREGMTLPPPLVWRPNNYRLRIPFLKGVEGKQEIKVIPRLFPVETFKGRNGMFSLKNFEDNLTIQAFPSCVLVTYSLKRDGVKAWLTLPGLAESSETEAFIDDFVESVHCRAIKAASRLNLRLDYDGAVWVRHEDEVKGEEFVDQLDPGLIMNDTYFKKVYSKGIEFKSPVYLKNFVANRALEKVSPEIVEALGSLQTEIKRISDASPGMALKSIQDRIKVWPDDVLLLDAEIRLLSDGEKETLSSWFLARFGGVA